MTPTPNPDRRIGEEKPVNNNQTSEAGEDPIDYPDVPLSVALVNSNLSIQDRLWALQAINDRRHLRAQLAEAEKRGARHEDLAIRYAREADEVSRRCAESEKERDALRGQLAEARKERDWLRRDLCEIAKGCGVGVPDEAEAKRRIIAIRAERDALMETLGRDGEYLKREPTNDDKRIESADYRGKSVWAWWAKAHAYGHMVHGVNPILGAKDGEHTNDAAKRVVAERDAAQARVGARGELLRRALAELYQFTACHSLKRDIEAALAGGVVQ